ncbi:single-stranded DNA-binding protein [Richelia sinica FACHB-800]|jgi:single-strand DNA-binding protein|uniref:Single-stranded DNA-binding protein n=1 Tax=Richelia sinica FACHB-800 TaxID=1357546 RepID=A0A975T7S8_9NOST|nr:single-stranded DNA-binding protein [Richelia sinica]MBD2665216.1 single-stranded DNA-binding protein [Richelia sinica FACHB-800]QXE23722.1 single-stranded DNA-binding protein [Richelia sinica FACHB-800]
MSINVVTLIGRVGTDPEMKYYDSGSVVCKLTLAVNRRSRNSDKPDWFNLELWGKTAEVAGNYVRKGKQIAVKGSLKFNTWNDRQTGALRSSPVIQVEQLELLGSKRDEEGDMGDMSPDNF